MRSVIHTYFGTRSYIEIARNSRMLGPCQDNREMISLMKMHTRARLDISFFRVLYAYTRISYMFIVARTVCLRMRTARTSIFARVAISRVGYLFKVLLCARMLRSASLHKCSTWRAETERQCRPHPLDVHCSNLVGIYIR